MLTKDEAEARVARGAAHLDRAKPGWFNRIDVGTLTLHEGCQCIVGQLAGGRFDLLAIGLNNSFSAGFKHGFSYASDVIGDGEAEEWQPLQDAWIQEIAKRLPVVEPIVETAPNGTRSYDALPVRPTVQMNASARYPLAPPVAVLLSETPE